MSGNPAAGLLLLLVGVFLLLSFVTGRLDWLFSLGHDVEAARTGAVAASPGATPATGAAAIPYPGTAPVLPPPVYA